MSLKASFAKYLPHFDSERAASEPASTNVKQNSRKESTHSIFSSLTKKFSGRNRRSEGGAQPAYRMGASARVHPETSESSVGASKARANEILPPPLQKRFQTLRGDPVPSENELFARFDALKGGPPPSQEELFARLDALKDSVKKTSAPAKHEPAADLHTLMQEIKAKPGPIWTASKNQTKKVSLPSAQTRLTANTVQATPSPKRAYEGQSGKPQLFAPRPGQDTHVLSKPIATAPSGQARKPPTRVSMNNFNDKGVGKQSGSWNLAKQVAQPHSVGGKDASDLTTRSLAEFEKEEAARADYFNEYPNMNAAHAKFLAQFAPTSEISKRSSVKSHVTSAQSTSTGHASNQPVRSLAEFEKEEAARAEHFNERPSMATAKEKYNAQFLPQPGQIRHQRATTRNHSTRAESWHSSSIEKPSERPIMPLSHFEKEENDRADYHNERPDSSNALNAWLRQFD